MSYARNYHRQGGTMHDERWNSLNRNGFNSRNRNMDLSRNNSYSNHNWSYNNSSFRDFVWMFQDQFNENGNYVKPCPPNGAPSFKRRKFSSGSWGDSGGGSYYPQRVAYENAVPLAYNNTLQPPARFNTEVSTSGSCKRDRSKLDEDEPVFMSKDDIERISPSRKDGIDALRETHLRYSYCAFLQNLGMRLEIPQTTIGTAMVLCHRFFVRRSHACHDRYLIATAALFLASKSEETPCPLNNTLRASCEILHKQDISFLSYLLSGNWFEQYRERVLGAEQMILTTLNFELNVQHPYDPLTSVLSKLGLSSALVNLALNLVSEGLRSSLWLQFKPHHIAAGAAYLAAKFLNLDLASYQNVWHEFDATPAILHDVSQQLMELF